ncbi:Fasciclin-2-like protein, partial [Leptotrombidium deliense]
MSALVSKDKSFRFNGAYKCEANVLGKQIATEKVILSSVENYALFENCPEEITVIQDRNESVLLCYVSDHKLFLISVIKFGMRSFQKPMYSFSDGNISLNSPILEGKYIITAYVKKSSIKIRKEAIIQVLIKHKFEIYASTHSPTTDEDFSLSCNYTGNSMATVKWQYSSKQSNVIVKRTTLMFKKLSKSNEGLYNCVVSKKSGNLSRSYRIFVSRDPAIIRFGNVTAREGTETKLACMAIGDPLPLITIRRFDGASISSNEKMTTSNSSLYVYMTLAIKRVMQNDAGVYECTASTGDDTYTIRSRQFAFLQVTRNAFLPAAIDDDNSSS